MRQRAGDLNLFARLHGRSPGRVLLYAFGLMGGVLAGIILASVARLDHALLAAPVAIPDAESSVLRIESQATGIGRTGSTDANFWSRTPSQRLAFKPKPGAAPQIILVIDDVGLNSAAFRRLLALPGPLTLSFLPYSRNVADMATEAAARGHDVFLHLPMQPLGAGADPGPDALTVTATPAQLRAALDRNLASIGNISGVNNHMGSLFTTDAEAMTVVLAELKRRNLVYLDSLTTRKSASSRVSQELAMDILVRDVFLDSDPGAQNVRRQLAEVELIAIKYGYAVAIAHPYNTTIDTLEAWLVSLEVRGFELATARDILAPDSETSAEFSVLR